jgi:hypothetical protein
MIFAVSFEIIIQRAVGNESCYQCYPMKNTLIITPIGVENSSLFDEFLCKLRFFGTSGPV